MVEFAQVMRAGEPMARSYDSRILAGLRANPFARATTLSRAGLPLRNEGLSANRAEYPPGGRFRRAELHSVTQTSI